MFGQLGFFNKFASKAYEDERPHDRYATESARLLGVLDERLAGRDWVMGADYNIADISLLGWVCNLIGFYEARELVGFDRFLHVQAWLNRGLARWAARAGSDGGLERLEVELMLRGVIRERCGGAASGCWPMSSRAANRST